VRDAARRWRVGASVLLNYPIGAAALQSRRGLLFASAVAVAVFRLNLQWDPASVLGGALRGNDVCVLATWTSLIVLFFGFEFVLRATIDIWRHYFEVVDELNRDEAEGAPVSDDSRATRVLRQLRELQSRRGRELAVQCLVAALLFDYVVPIVVGVYAVYEVRAHPCS
jgi:hypothetical protein